MIIKIKKRTNNFAQIDKRSLEDDRLSWKAKGILAYLLSKPDNWEVVIDDLQKHATDGRDSCRTGLRELEEKGYIRKHQERGSDGLFKPVEYQVFETPELAKKGFKANETGNGLSANGSTVNGSSANGKSHTSNIDRSNNELSNKEKESSPFLRDLEIGDFPKDERLKRFTVYCWQGVKENYPDHKTVHEAKFDTWYDPLRLLVEQDEVEIPKARKLWDWAISHEFWKANIRSTAKFRDQFETLDAQMKAKAEKKKKTNRLKAPLPQ
ncbi:hypothetical protein ACG2F4_07245 [Halalkalibaculum sp. DA3122]|uniref:hypothetical protein n=1 Tax=Halalkalibaculum sp. DA3122 TaxID=3373607 RepID=UPI0037544F41